MANLPLGFAELAAGAVLLIAGLQNKTPAQVLLGQASTAAPAISVTAGGAVAPSSDPGAPSGATQIPGTTSTLGSGAGPKAAQAALDWLHVPYVYGGLSKLGIDCSGLVVEAYKAVGVDLPHNAAQQWLYVKEHGTVKTLASIVPGDLIFLEPSSSGPDHVAIATGNGFAVEAPHTASYPGDPNGEVKTIKISDLVHYDGLVGVGSPLANQ